MADKKRRDSKYQLWQALAHLVCQVSTDEGTVVDATEQEGSQHRQKVNQMQRETVKDKV